MQITNSFAAINWIYFGLVVIWFGLLKLLFNRLEQDHPKKYEAMGWPSLFLRNNIATNLATFKFLFLREHLQLGDPGLSRLANGMLLYFVVLIAAVLGLIVALLRGAA
jgi:hypothetical protein